MAANFSKPITTDLYTDILTTIRDNITDSIKMLDGSTATNIPSGAIRWSTANGRFEKYNGSTWSALLSVATTSVDGFLSAADKTKINALSTGSSTTKQTSVTDTTSGRLMIVGAFGLGASVPTALSAASAFDSIAVTSFYYVAAANVATVGGPSGAGAGVVSTIRYSSTYAVQTYSQVTTAVKSWSRICNNSVWSTWVENLNTGNILNTHIPEDSTHRWATDALITAWNAAKTHADSAHSPSNAQKNSDITKAEIEAKLVGELTSHSHAAVPGVLPGAIQFFPTSSAPTGYLKANGAAVSRTTYAALFAAIGTAAGAGDGATTFNVPDLRGEFVRGLDDGRGVDSARVLASAQAGQNLSHTHTTDSQGAHTHTVPTALAGQSGSTAAPQRIWDSAAGTAATTSSAGAHTHTAAAAGGTEARPRNVALLACIKF
jgi:microcystin-dependent protein